MKGDVENSVDRVANCIICEVVGVEVDRVVERGVGKDVESATGIY